jgi:hypothetical protein
MHKVPILLTRRANGEPIFHRWWINLITHHSNLQLVHEEIKKCSGSMTQAGNFVTFDTEQDYLMFVLKWG